MRFRFETLLRIRKNQENRIQRDLGTINAHLVRQQEHLSEWQEKNFKSHDEYNRRLESTEDVTALARYDDFFQSAKVHTAHQRRIIQEIEGHVDRKRMELADSMKKRRTLEILRERHLEAWKKEQQRQETAFLDEVAGTRRHRGVS